MFYNMNFRFNGVDSSQMYGAFFCQFKNNSDGRIVGIHQSIKSEESGITGIYNYVDTKRDTITFPVEISFSKKLSSTERKSVLEWLFPLDDEYKELEVEDNGISYFVKFKSGKWKEYPTVDILSLDAETDSAYGYTPIVNYNVELNATTPSKNLTIENHCDVMKYYAPEIEITFKKAGTLTIKNNTINETMSITGALNEVVKINCAREVVTSSVKQFKYGDIVNFLRLKYGVNQLTLSGVDAIINIKCRFYVLFQ